MEYKDRIKAARKHASLTQIELAKLVGIDQTSISDLERGKSQSSSHSARIATACGVNALWLEQGIGEMTDGTSFAAPVAAKIAAAGGPAAALMHTLLESKAGKSLPDDVRARLRQAAENPQEDSDRSNVIQGDFGRATVVKGGMISIAQYDVRAAMGGGQVPAEYREFVRNLVVEKVQLDDMGIKYTDPTNLKIITGWGQSMIGTIEDKSPLIVDIGVTDFVDEGVYVFTWLGHLFIKRVQLLDAEHFQLVSDNKAFEPQKARMEDMYFQAKVLGVWNFKKL